MHVQHNHKHIDRLQPKVCTCVSIASNLYNSIVIRIEKKTKQLKLFSCVFVVCSNVTLDFELIVVDAVAVAMPIQFYAVPFACMVL